MRIGMLAVVQRLWTAVYRFMVSVLLPNCLVFPLISGCPSLWGVGLTSRPMFQAIGGCSGHSKMLVHPPCLLTESGWTH